ncbi:MAG: nitrite reductase, partial [Clostridium baratii]|nr:nitrite reductase [Clostridium baratii]
VCKHGMIDTRKLSKKIEAEFLGREVPAKFKIGIFGCMNSYGKAQSNDFAVIPKFNIVMNQMEFLVFLGGRSGRRSRKATPMKKRFKEEELSRLIDKTINFYNENAIKKERFAEVIERLGQRKVESEIIKSFKSNI